MTGESLRLSIAAEPSQLAVTRAFVASAMWVRGQPQGLIDDARLAVSELLTVLVINEQGPIDLVYSEDDSHLVFSIEAAGAPPAVGNELTDLLQRLSEGGFRQEEDRWLIKFLRQ